MLSEQREKGMKFNMKELKNYQIDAIKQLMDFTNMFLERNRNETIIFQSPTGSGKRHIANAKLNS